MRDLTISIIVPVYNEADYLPSCLNAIAKQTISPLEVIIVDNNSTDKTVEIAKKYPFVRVIKENRQGVVFASFAGYIAAKGDIIGRIDGDSVIPKDWTAKVIKTFERKKVDGLSGRLEFYDLCFPGLFNFVDKYMRHLVFSLIKNSAVLQGNNMAVTKQSWLNVKNDLHLTNDVDDETDLAVHLGVAGAKVIYDPSLVAKVSARRVNRGFIDGYRYFKKLPYTYKMHGVKRVYLFNFVIVVIAIFYLPIKLAHALYKNKWLRF